MPYCNQCGEKLNCTDRFCSSCGAAANGSTENQNQTRKQVFEGEIHKCPQCGEVIDAFVSNCPICGFEFRSEESENSVRAFTRKLSEIESERNETKKAGIIIERTGEKGISIKRPDPRAIDQIDLKKIDLISNFVMPNTKEDLLEFMILASSNINPEASASPKALSDAWEAKFKQAYQKATILFREKPDLNAFEELYKKKNSEIQKYKKKELGFILLGFGFMFAMFFLLFLFAVNPGETKRENKRLEAIVEQVYDCIDEEKYVLARAKASSLVFGGSSKDQKERWEKTRESLLIIIDAAERGETINRDMLIETAEQNIQ